MIKFFLNKTISNVVQRLIPLKLNLKTGSRVNMGTHCLSPTALFETTTRNVSETFPLEVTMDWWAVNNWMMIHIWSVAWLTHAAINLFKRCGAKG